MMQANKSPETTTSYSVRQIIYEHGGSRIWTETPEGDKELLADTYLSAEYSKAVRDFSEEWLRRNQ